MDNPGLVYLGPDPTNPDAHQVIGGDGNVYTVPLSGLPPEVQAQAVNQAQQNQGPTPASNGPPPSGSTMPPGLPTIDTIASSAVGALRGLANIGTGTDTAPPPTAAPVPTPPGGNPPPPAAPSGPPIIPTPTQARMGGGGGVPAAPINPGVQVDLNKGALDSQAAINEQYALTKRAGAEDTAALGAQSAEAGQRIDAFKTAQQQAQNQSMDQLNKASAVMDDYLKSSIQPFPQNVGTRLQNALAFMISGFGQGVAGQKENMAAAAHTNEVNQWLEQQKFNIEHKKAAAEGYMQLSQKFLDLGMSQRQAFDATDLAISNKAKLDAAKMVAARGDQQALVNFHTAAAGWRDDHAQKQMNLTKSTTEAQLAQAQTLHARAAAAHENAETAQLGLTSGITAAAMTGQRNLANGHPFMSLPPEQQQAVLRTAQQNKMLLPGVGVTQREIAPDEAAQMRDLDTARSLIGDLDQMTKSTTLNPMQQAAAASKAQTLQALLPKVLGSQARLSPASEQALGNIIPAKPGRWFEPWQAESKAIKSTLGEVQAPLEKSMGLTRFRPLPPPENQKPVG